MVLDSILSNAEYGPNDHRKDAPLFNLNYVNHLSSTLEKEMDNFRSDKNLMLLSDIQNKHLMDSLMKARISLVKKIQYECASIIKDYDD